MKGSLHLANFVITYLEQVLVQVSVQDLARKILQNDIQENVDIIYFDWCWITIT